MRIHSDRNPDAKRIRIRNTNNDNVSHLATTVPYAPYNFPNVFIYQNFSSEASFKGVIFLISLAEPLVRSCRHFFPIVGSTGQVHAEEWKGGRLSLGATAQEEQQEGI
jgi:hypothetical protein